MCVCVYVSNVEKKYDFLKAIPEVQVVKEQTDKLNLRKIKTPALQKSEEIDKPCTENICKL